MTRGIPALGVAVLCLSGLPACGGGGEGTDTSVAQDPGVAPDTDGARDVIGDGLGACPLAGTWKGPVPGGPFAGQTLTYALQAGGATSGAMGTASVLGTWEWISGVLTVADTSSTPASVACPAGQAGTYSVAFSADCTQATFTATDEPCEGRKVVLDGFVGVLQG